MYEKIGMGAVVLIALFFAALNAHAIYAVIQDVRGKTQWWERGPLVDASFALVTLEVVVLIGIALSYVIGHIMVKLQ